MSINDPTLLTVAKQDFFSDRIILRSFIQIKSSDPRHFTPG